MSAAERTTLQVRRLPNQVPLQTMLAPRTPPCRRPPPQVYRDCLRLVKHMAGVQVSERRHASPHACVPRHCLWRTLLTERQGSHTPSGRAHAIPREQVRNQPGVGQAAAGAVRVPPAALHLGAAPVSSTATTPPPPTPRRAERALSQYLFYERTRSDPKFKAHLQDQAATAMAGEGASPEARAAAGKQAALDLTAMTGVDRGSIQSFIEAEQETLAGASPDQVAELIAAGALTPDYGDEDAEEGEGEWDPYADDDDEEEGGGGHLDLDADVAQFVLDAKQRDALLAADAEAAAQRK